MKKIHGRTDNENTAVIRLRQNSWGDVSGKMFHIWKHRYVNIQVSNVIKLNSLQTILLK